MSCLHFRKWRATSCGGWSVSKGAPASQRLIRSQRPGGLAGGGGLRDALGRILGPGHPPINPPPPQTTTASEFAGLNNSSSAPRSCGSPRGAPGLALAARLFRLLHPVEVGPALSVPLGIIQVPPCARFRPDGGQTATSLEKELEYSSC